jgi:hypothetical protein
MMIKPGRTCTIFGWLIVMLTTASITAMRSRVSSNNKAPVSTTLLNLCTVTLGSNTVTLKPRTRVHLHNIWVAHCDARNRLHHSHALPRQQQKGTILYDLRSANQALPSSPQPSLCTVTLRKRSHREIKKQAAPAQYSVADCDAYNRLHHSHALPWPQQQQGTCLTVCARN